MGIFLERGRLLFGQKRYDLAAREFRQELSNEPDNTSAHAMLGLCYLHLKRSEEALKLCREAVRLAPTSAYAHYALAFVLDDRDQLDEAAAAIEEAIRLNPRDADYFGQLSYIRLRQARYPEALAAADAGLHLDARSAFCLQRRGSALGHVGRLAEAENVLRAALAIKPEGALTQALLGWVLTKQKRPVTALEHLREAMRLDPQMDWARERTIDALVQLIEGRRIQQANAWFTEAMQSDPQLEDGRQRLLAALREHSSGIMFGIQIYWTVLAVAALLTLPKMLGRDLAQLALLVSGVAFGARGGLLSEPMANVVLMARRLGRRLVSRRQLREARRSCFGLVVGTCLAALAIVFPRRTENVAAVCALSLVVPVVALDRWTETPIRRGWLVGLGLLMAMGGTLLVLSATERVPDDWIAGGATVQLVVGVCGAEVVGLILKGRRKRQL